MKKFLSFTMMAMIGLWLFSCSEDEVAPLEDGKVNIPDAFTELTDEQNKAELEKNGQQLLTDIDGMNDLQIIDVYQSFNNFAGISEPQTNGRLLKSLTGIEESASVGEIFTALRTTEEEFTSLQQLFDEYSGTFTWNPTLQDWDFVAGTGKIELLFPGTSTGTTNDAKILIHSYKSITGPNPLGEEYTGDLPTQVLMDITYKGTNVLAYVFNAAYNDKGEPTDVSTSLTLAPYKFEVKVVNTTSLVSVKYNLSKSGKVLISMGAGAEGEFTEAAYDAGEGEGMVTTGNVYFRLLDVTLAGNVDVKKMEAGIEAIYTEEYDAEGNYNFEFDYDAAAVEEAKLWNENVNLVAFYNSSKKKIAEADFYTYERVNTWTDYVWNDQLQDYEMVTRTDTNTRMDVRLIFSDGSKSDLETYFNTGFEDITTDLETFFEGFNR